MNEQINLGSIVIMRDHGLSNWYIIQFPKVKPHWSIRVSTTFKDYLFAIEYYESTEIKFYILELCTEAIYR